MKNSQNILNPIPTLTLDANVDELEFKRLLGYPMDHSIDDPSVTLMKQTREWYNKHGNPFTHLKLVEMTPLDEGTVLLEGHVFHSKRLIHNQVCCSS